MEDSIDTVVSPIFHRYRSVVGKPATVLNLSRRPGQSPVCGRIATLRGGVKVVQSNRLLRVHIPQNESQGELCDSIEALNGVLGEVDLTVNEIEIDFSDLKSLSQVVFNSLLLRGRQLKARGTDIQLILSPWQLPPQPVLVKLASLFDVRLSRCSSDDRLGPVTQ